MCAQVVRPARPVRPAVPPLPQIDALDRTHKQVMDHLAEMRVLIDKLDQAGVDPAARAMATDICRFFSAHARQHHADEERLVFPALLRSSDESLVQHVLRLQQDHGWLEEDWLELELQLQAVAAGYSWYDLDSLRHAVSVFTALYHEHIALEESLVYPAARRRLEAEQDGIAHRTGGED
ncbi:MAG: hemerythrin domain-containing protein [Burkholderiales bacterium]|nr:hemerythrin domain-containing protein [Burkholderiales bacterium]